MRRPAYLRLLVGILVFYALMIGFGGTLLGDPIRVALMGGLLWLAIRPHGRREMGWLRTGTIAFTALAVAATAWSSVAGAPWLASAVVGFAAFALTSMLIVVLTLSLIDRGRVEVDLQTVLGVLCVYLLLALFFAELNQVVGAFVPGYLHGVGYPPSASDLLYFSVITIATVGYGDITPATEAARAIVVVEALVGQLYLVSIVAAVVGGWHRRT
jgi:hypothetical protein